MCDSLVRIYQSEGIEVQALQGLDLLVEAGELVAIVGASGSGKSTLLSVLSGLDVPTAGRVRVGTWDLMTMTARQRVEYRRSMVGFVWQQTARNLVPYLTAAENVAFPLMLAGAPARERARRTDELLAVLGIGYCADRRPGEMSGGEQQRVAIAVGLANAPQVLFADEPTGELDTATSHDVLESLRTVEPRARHDDRHRHPRPRRLRARAAHDRDPGRPDVVGDRAPDAHPGGRHGARHRRGARRAGPRRPRPAPARVPRGARPGRTRAARARGVARVGAARGTPAPTRSSDDRHDARRTDGTTVEPAVRVEHVSRVYGHGAAAVHAVQDVSFTVAPGELVALVGRSGSGKTTLLNCIGGLDRPDAGRVVVDGREVSSLDESGLVELRRDVVSFIFQTFGLVPVLSAAENVGVPLRLRRAPTADREARVQLLLDLVGLGAHTAQRPAELSGGQQQRVAIARALATSPRLLIADEPTGQLDTETGTAVMALLRAVVEAEGMTAIVSTHDPLMMALADRVVRLADGRLVEG